VKTATAIVLFVLVSIAATATTGEPRKVSLNATNTPLKDVCAQLSEQSGALIVLDPKAQANTTISLQDSELAGALDAITKVSKLTWRKVQFARPNEDSVRLEQIKSAIVTLAALPMVAVAVDDPASKTSSVYAKGLPAAPDTTAIKLPDGYTWTTAYVILAPEVSASAAASGQKDRVQSLTESQTKTMAELANMPSEERKQVFAGEMAAQMSMAPEVRKAMLKDRIQAMLGMDPRMRDQFRDDMRAVFKKAPGGGKNVRQNSGSAKSEKKRDRSK